MDINNKQWDIADNDLTNWLNGTNDESNLQLSDILKSIYLTFRQKQLERLSQFCTQGFESYLENERIKFLKILEPKIEDSEIRFRKAADFERDINAETYRENQRIIKSILSGDYKIFNMLYEYEFPKVVNLITKNSGSVEQAKDVFQEAIVILMEKVYTKKLDLTCSVKTYLSSICKYLWLEQLRLNKKQKQMIDFYDNVFNSDEITIHFYNTPDIFDVVSSAIDTLGNPCKQLLECYYYKNMTWDEIATSLGYSNAASARNQKYKCLERIRKAVNLEVD